MQLRSVILQELPGITEHIDLPARMLIYGYGEQYKDIVCALIPSQNGVKVSFAKGATLPDPDHLLEGKGKVTRYIDFAKKKIVNEETLIKYIQNALALHSHSQ